MATETTSSPPKASHQLSEEKEKKTNEDSGDGHQLMKSEGSEPTTDEMQTPPCSEMPSEQLPLQLEETAAVVVESVDDPMNKEDSIIDECDTSDTLEDESEKYFDFSNEFSKEHDTLENEVIEEMIQNEEAHRCCAAPPQEGAAPPQEGATIHSARKKSEKSLGDVPDEEELIKSVPIESVPKKFCCEKGDESEYLIESVTLVEALIAQVDDVGFSEESSEMKATQTDINLEPEECDCQEDSDDSACLSETDDEVLLVKSAEYEGLCDASSEVTTRIRSLKLEKNDVQVQDEADESHLCEKLPETTFDAKPEDKESGDRVQGAKGPLKNAKEPLKQAKEPLNDTGVPQKDADQADSFKTESA